MIPPRSRALLVLSTVIAVPVHSQTPDLRLRSAILAAEDLRPTTSDGLAPIRAGLASPDTVAQRLAVRALGRLEQPTLVTDIAPLLAAAPASVRAEAASALGQAVVQGDPAPSRRLLEDRLGLETNPEVRGAIFRTLGRLAAPTKDLRDATERLLVQGSRSPGGDAPEAVREGIAHGLAALYRRTASTMAPSVEALERLVELTAPGQPVRVRRLAMAAFANGGRVDSGALLDALRDPDVEVRRLATAAAGAPADLPGRERIIGRALADPAAPVRYEALRAYGRRQMAGDGCMPMVLALDDRDRQVELLAIDLLSGCGAPVARTLAAIAAEPVTDDDWHRPAHALVSLAQISPELAAPLLAEAGTSPVWWVRMYAARAAERARADPLLDRLAVQPHPNAREAALAALQRLRGHAADRFFRLALSSDDPQLLRTAAVALDSTPDPAAALPALLGALERITRARRETSRDARAALLHTLAALADSPRAPDLRGYLTDFDPAIAEQAAGILSRWSGAPVAPAPRPLARAPVPSWEELEHLARLRVVIVMRDGSRIGLRLRPHDAATNTARFVRLVRAGWFNGLTFHRVVPNFVVQGGSPGANEYFGDGPFTRDELGLVSNLRGTVGVSTRGRDTGDGQIYVNLVDNIRLDHDYTVFADVIAGMDIVDGLMEGAIIETILLTDGE